MKSNILVVFLSFLSISNQSLAITSLKNLRNQALVESQIEGQQKQSATTAQVSSGMLVLKDPRPEIITRSWKLFAGLKGQTYSPSGAYTSDLGTNFSLNRAGQAFMPGLLVGAQTKNFDLPNYIKIDPRVKWNLGLRADASIASQSTATTFKSGYSISDCRLNTIIFSVGPSFSITLLQTDKKYLPTMTVTPQIGSLDYTQTSSNEFARFNRQFNFESINLEASLNATPSVQIFASYTQRNSLSASNQVTVQKDNFEMGSKVTW
jgi:hypothetical protein